MKAAGYCTKVMDRRGYFAVLPVRLLIYQEMYECWRACVFIVIDSGEPVAGRLQLDASARRHRSRLVHRRSDHADSRRPALVSASRRRPQRPDDQHHAVRLRPRRRAVVAGRASVGVGGCRPTPAVLPGARVHRRGRTKPGCTAMSSGSTANSSSLSVSRPGCHGSFQRPAS